MAGYEPVVFEDSQGNTISNDPIYLAQQQLAAAGLINPQSSQPVDGDDTSLEDDGEVDYSKLNGRDLKALAKERGVDITGIRTVGELRQALAAADAETDEPGTDSADEDSE